MAIVATDAASRSADSPQKGKTGALAEARREVVRRCLPFDLDHDQFARAEWGDRGLTLAQRDHAVDELVAADEAVIDASRFGITVKAVAP
jgi:hypothetical protein